MKLFIRTKSQPHIAFFSELIPLQVSCFIPPGGFFFRLGEWQLGTPQYWTTSVKHCEVSPLSHTLPLATSSLSADPGFGESPKQHGEGLVPRGVIPPFRSLFCLILRTILKKDQESKVLHPPKRNTFISHFLGQAMSTHVVDTAKHRWYQIIECRSWSPMLPLPCARSTQRKERIHVLDASLVIQRLPWIQWQDLCIKSNGTAKCVLTRREYGIIVSWSPFKTAKIFCRIEIRKRTWIHLDEKRISLTFNLQWLNPVPCVAHDLFKQNPLSGATDLFGLKHCGASALCLSRPPTRVGKQRSSVRWRSFLWPRPDFLEVYRAIRREACSETQRKLKAGSDTETCVRVDASHNSNHNVQESEWVWDHAVLTSSLPGFSGKQIKVISSGIQQAYSWHQCSPNSFPLQDAGSKNLVNCTFSGCVLFVWIKRRRCLIAHLQETEQGGCLPPWRKKRLHHAFLWYRLCCFLPVLNEHFSEAPYVWSFLDSSKHTKIILANTKGNLSCKEHPSTRLCHGCSIKFSSIVRWKKSTQWHRRFSALGSHFVQWICSEYGSKCHFACGDVSKTSTLKWHWLHFVQFLCSRIKARCRQIMQSSNCILVDTQFQILERNNANFDVTNGRIFLRWRPLWCVQHLRL